MGKNKVITPPVTEKRELEPVMVRMYKDQHEALKQVSNETGASVQFMVRKAIDEYIQRMK